MQLAAWWFHHDVFPYVPAMLATSHMAMSHLLGREGMIRRAVRTAAEGQTHIPPPQSRTTCQKQSGRVHRRCGDGARDAWSSVRSFATLQASGPHAFPQRFGIIGDLGQTYNSTATLRHLAKSEPPVRCTLEAGIVQRGG